MHLSMNLHKIKNRRTNMKNTDVKIGTMVQIISRIDQHKNPVYSNQTGKVIAYSSQGDEVIVLELNENYDFKPVLANINDCKILSTK